MNYLSQASTVENRYYDAIPDELLDPRFQDWTLAKFEVEKKDEIALKVYFYSLAANTYDCVTFSRSGGFKFGALATLAEKVGCSVDRVYKGNKPGSIVVAFSDSDVMVIGGQP